MYGADRKWVLLKPVPIELDDEEMGEAAGSQEQRERVTTDTRLPLRFAGQT